jgi:hypothetical protein
MEGAAAIHGVRKLIVRETKHIGTPDDIHYHSRQS